MKRELTTNDRLNLVGLKAIADRLRSQLDTIEGAVAQVIGEEKESGFYNVASDFVWDSKEPLVAADSLAEWMATQDVYPVE